MHQNVKKKKKKTGRVYTKMLIVVYFKIVGVPYFLLKIFLFSEFYTIAFIKTTNKQSFL